MINLVLILLVLVHLPQIRTTASNSLSDCNTVAAKFDNTCGGTAPTSITATAGLNVSCTSGFTSSTCPGTFSSGTCVFAHKMCVTCSGTTTIRIRVQTNGLPRYCPNSPNAIVETNIDFTTNFNPDVSINSPVHSPSTQAALYGIVCNISSQASVPSWSSFTLGSNSVSLSTVAGVSIDGVSIENVNSANNIDPFYPPGSNSAEMVDACLGHPNFASVYHYHMASACAVNRPTGSIQPCAGVTACAANVSNYGITQFNSYRNLTVIGIAKDGHIIYGPYYSSGAEVTTGFDICNGVFHDTIGNYAYFATRTFPYITGCFGPGNYPSFRPNCTTNPATSYTVLSFSNATTTTVTTTTATTATTTTATTTTATTATTTTATTTTTTTATTATTTSTRSDASSIIYAGYFIGGKWIPFARLSLVWFLSKTFHFLY